MRWERGFHPAEKRWERWAVLGVFSCFFFVVSENIAIFAAKTYAAFHMSALMSAGFGRFVSLFLFRVTASYKR